MTDQEMAEAIREGRYTVEPCDVKRWPDLYEVVVDSDDGAAWSVAYSGSREACLEFVAAIRAAAYRDQERKEA